MSIVVAQDQTALHRVKGLRFDGGVCEVVILVGFGRVLVSPVKTTSRYIDDDTQETLEVHTLGCHDDDSDKRDIASSDDDNDDDHRHKGACCGRHAYNDYDYRGRPEGNRLARLQFPVEQVAPSPQRQVMYRTKNEQRNQKQSRRHHQTNNQKRQQYGATKQAGGGIRRGRV